MTCRPWPARHRPPHPDVLDDPWADYWPGEERQVTDILDRIDATVEGLCACGCRQSITGASPSAYYATETCQAAWWAQARGLPRAPAIRISPETQRQATDALRRAFVSINVAVQQFVAATAPLVEGMNYFMDAAYEPRPEPADHPLARINARRRNQQHGPQRAQRPPRQLRP